MRAVVQRVLRCRVTVAGEESGTIGPGLLVYLGVEEGDQDKDLMYLCEKISGLRIFKDDAGKMNLSVEDIRGSIMVVSQFTLCADTRKGKRPSYNRAAAPELAKSFYLRMISTFKEREIPVASGIFAASMQVEYINDGPVTILLDSNKAF